MGLEVRAGNPADAVIADRIVMPVAHRPWILVTMLDFAFTKINSVRIQAAWGACLEPTKTDAILSEAFRKFIGTRLPYSSTDASIKTRKHAGSEEGSAGNH